LADYDRPVLWARSEEKEAIDAHLEAAKAGRGGALRLTGEAGIGKSSLLAYAERRADGMRVLRAQAAEDEAALPYATLHQLLRGVLRGLHRLPAPQTRALGVALGLEDGPAPDRFLISVATLTLLSDLAAERPVLCLVDNGQWADASSVGTIAFVARRLQSDAIALIVAERPGASEILSRSGIPRLCVEGLAPDVAAALLEAQRGDGLATGVRDALVRAAGGNPLALTELPGMLAPDQLSGRVPLPDPLPIAEVLERAFLELVAARAPGARTLALICAAEASGTADTIERAARALGIDDLAAKLTDLADLLRLEGPTVTFRHPLIRSAVYQGAEPAARRAAHLAIADALGVHPDEADRRAWHRAQAVVGPDEEVAQELELSAQRAARRSGFAAASLVLERAADISRSSEGRVRRLVAAADGAWRGGDAPRALALVDHAERSETARDAVWLNLRYLRGLVEIRSGVPAAGLAILLQAVTDAGSSDPSLAVRMLISASEAAFEAGDPEAPRTIGVLMAGLPPPAEPVDALQMRLYLAVSPRQTGGVQERIDEDLRWTEGLDDPDVLFRVGGMAFGLGQHRIAHLLRSRAVERARALGAAGTLAWALRALAADEASRGRYAWAEACADEGLQLAIETGQPNLACRLRVALAEAVSVRGPGDEGRSLAEVALAEATARGLGGTAAHAHRVLGLFALAGGRADEAIGHFENLWAMGAGVRGVAVASIADLVEAAVRAGRPELGAERLPALLSWADGGSGEAGALVRRCQALLAGDDEAGRLLEEAMALCERVDRPLEWARTALLYGEHLRRARHPRDAREHLRRALRTFESLGALHWAERAQVELRASGETGFVPRVGLLDVLTRQELQIVDAVSRGARNRDIAAQLFISPRTVDHHLRNVFRKLGVTSRTQLARLALDGRGGDGDAIAEGRLSERLP
jgi:DNA-binding CsgD family transcriptional regulator